MYTQPNTNIVNIMQICDFLRYQVHQKLSNFMAPMERGNMSDTARYCTCTCTLRVYVLPCDIW